MVIEYLEKMHHRMYEEKIKLEREYQKEEVVLNDTLKFINTLEESLDENFESFTPWKIYHENHTKIDILKEKQNVIENEMKNLKMKIEQYNKDISEILDVLEYTRNDLLLKKENESINYQKIMDSMIQDYKKIHRKIENCTKFVEIDAVRSRIELQTLSKQIYDSIQKYNKQIKNMEDSL